MVSKKFESRVLSFFFKILAMISGTKIMEEVVARVVNVPECRDNRWAVGPERHERVEPSQFQLMMTMIKSSQPIFVDYVER